MIDLRKHEAFGPNEQPSRAGLNAMSLSINDVVPVANVTERAQLVADLTSAGRAPSAAKPLLVQQADAPGVLWSHTSPTFADGTILTTSVAANLERSTPFFIAVSSPTDLAGWDEVSLHGGMTFNNTSGALTVPHAGRYRVSFSFFWQANAGGNRIAQVILNGTNSILADDSVNQGGRPTRMSGTRTLNLAANDNLRLRITQSGTGSIGADMGYQPVSFSAEFLGVK